MSKNKTGVELIAEERQRQIEVKGYDQDHDDLESSFQLSSAAAMFVCNAQNQYFKDHTHYDDRGDVVRFQARDITDDEDQAIEWKEEWPWSDKDGRATSGIVKSLVKAGALIAAEIDRLRELDHKLFDEIKS